MSGVQYVLPWKCAALSVWGSFGVKIISSLFARKLGAGMSPNVSPRNFAKIMFNAFERERYLSISNEISQLGRNVSNFTM